MSAQPTNTSLETIPKMRIKFFGLFNKNEEARNKWQDSKRRKNGEFHVEVKSTRKRVEDLGNMTKCKGKRKGIADNKFTSMGKFLNKQIMSRFGCLLELLNDQGKHIKNQVIKDFVDDCVIVHEKTSLNLLEKLWRTTISIWTTSSNSCYNMDGI